jgi:hypothetical protein
MDPGATLAGNLFVNLTSSIDLDYTIGDWVFGATSGFDRLGWSSMSFDVAGVLGAFTLTGVMNFEPRTVTKAVWTYADGLGATTFTTPIFPSWEGCWFGDETYVEYTYGAAFDDLKFVASVSIAGVSIEALFFLNEYNGDFKVAPIAFYWAGSTTAVIQTSGDVAHYLGAVGAYLGEGAGYRFKISGTAGALDITSYTYFSLTEPFVSSTSLAKKGTFTVSTCMVGFTEQYFNVDGFTVGCATFEAGLRITCDGFSWVALRAYDIDLGVWGLLGDFTVKFTTLVKSVSFTLDFDLDVVCFEIGTTLDYADYMVGGFSIDSLILDTEIGGVSFVSTTYFDGEISKVYDAANQITWLKPVTGMETSATSELPMASIDTEFVGYYDAVCLMTEYWSVWETFEISIDGDSCCGGAFDFTLETGMGTKKELHAAAWNYQYDDTAGSSVDINESAILIGAAVTTGDPVYTVISVLGDADADNNGTIDLINFEATVGDTELEVLNYDTVYADASSDSLFAWVYTNVDMSVDLGTAWALTFGAEIDVYGWNELSFGFEFEF